MYTTDERASASSGKVHPTIDDAPGLATVCEEMDEQVCFQSLPSAASQFDAVAPIEVQSREGQPKGNETGRDSGVTEFRRGRKNIHIQVDSIAG
jgi:hypothetical protein